MTPFKEAFKLTMLHEGRYSKDIDDPGGETFMGISRVYWPGWVGWHIIDRFSGGQIMPNSTRQVLLIKTEDFYRENFWNRFRGNEVAQRSRNVAYELFDTGVNLGVHRAASWLQEALNLLNGNERFYPDMIVDGLIGPTTLETLRAFLAQEPHKARKEIMLLNVMNTLQGKHYIEQMIKWPKKEKFRGWFMRV